jgi:acyl carrier protein
MTTIEQQVIAIIQQELKLSAAPELTDDLAKFDADSLDRAEIIFSLEDEFGININIPDKETARRVFTTVQGVVDWVSQQLDTKKV